MIGRRAEKLGAEKVIEDSMDESKLLQRITFEAEIFGGKPVIRGRRLAVEQILGMLAAGDDAETLIADYPWLETEDIQACLVYVRRVIGSEQG